MNCSLINKILLPTLITTTFVLSIFCVTSNQWRIVTFGPATLNVGLYHLCRTADSRKLEFLITYFIDDRECMGLLDLKEKFSKYKDGPSEIPETLEIHVTSCITFPFIMLTSFIALVTSFLASLPFIKPKRNMLMIIATTSLFICSFLEIFTGWIYRSDLYKQKEKLDHKTSNPFDEDSFFGNIGNKIVNKDNIFKDALDAVNELASNTLVPGNASVYTAVLGGLNLAIFGYAVFILISERRTKSSYSEGIALR